jgi:hypothetical protein
MVLSMNAVGVTIGIGQIGLFLLPMLVAAVLLLRRERPGWRVDLLIAALLLPTLVKPTISVPFFCLLLLSPIRLRPALLVGVGYVALTLLAVLFQPIPLPALLHDWLARSTFAAGAEGYGNVHVGLATLGLQQWMLPSSALALAALAGWVYWHRNVEIWLLLGVTALVARLWAYHHVYDDILLLLPMVALFRITRRDHSGHGLLAGVGLAVMVLAMLLPARLFLPPSPLRPSLAPPWDGVFPAMHVVLWVALLIFLVAYAWRELHDRVGRPKTMVGVEGGQLLPTS